MLNGELTGAPVWISLAVATDVLPLLVNACSAECVAALPPPRSGYVPTPHTGGPDLVQPTTVLGSASVRPGTS
jgi:hypothetical protein